MYIALILGGWLIIGVNIAVIFAVMVLHVMYIIIGLANIAWFIIRIPIRVLGAICKLFSQKAKPTIDEVEL